MNTKPPRFSVVIPTYNRAARLADAVRSVMEQSYPAHEIIVVDDGSTDDTTAVVERLQNGAAPILYLRQVNQGVAAARNRGMAAASGNWIALLDSDDVWMPRKLENARKLIGAAPDTDFVHSRCIHDFEISTDSRPPPVTPEERCDPTILLAGWLIKTSSVLMAKPLLDRLGTAFRTDLRTCEDYELFWRAVVEARRVSYVPEQDTIIADMPNSLSRDDRLLERMMDNIRAMSHVLHWLDGRPEGPALAPIMERRRYWTVRLLLTRSARDGRLREVLGWLFRHGYGLSAREIGRALISAGRGLARGENPQST
jgi:glycosyltransferase involved in cell wall biosynthesis